MAIPWSRLREFYDNLNEIGERAKIIPKYIKIKLIFVAKKLLSAAAFPRLALQHPMLLFIPPKLKKAFASPSRPNVFSLLN